MIRVRGMFQKSLKNRSSKQLGFMTGPGTKPALWSWSGEALRAASASCESSKGNPFEAEIQRRLKNAAKRKTPRLPCKSKKDAAQ